MKSIYPSAGLLAAVLVTVALAGCATGRDAQHKQYHSQSTSSQMPATTGGGPGGDHIAMMDKKAMCDMHEKMMNAKTPEERKAMMNEHMKEMRPEMMQQQMQMMQQQCK